MNIIYEKQNKRLFVFMYGIRFQEAFKKLKMFIYNDMFVKVPRCVVLYWNDSKWQSTIQAEKKFIYNLAPVMEQYSMLNN